MEEAIIALATPNARSALAIVRVSGQNVFSITDGLFSKKVSGIEKRSSFVGIVKDGERIIDQVVLLAYPPANSVTGEELVEIISHGSPIITDEIVAAYVSRGVRYASRGEFTSRAYFNGKMDLVEAEAVNDLINARSAESKNLSLKTVLGAPSSRLREIKELLADALASLEVAIDFPEYESDETYNRERLGKTLAFLRSDLEREIAGGKTSRIIKDGVSVAIVGLPNVGKSSLINAIAGEDKAIVTDIPGTTRDIVEATVAIDGIQFRFFDTAGLRDSDDLVEFLGVKKAKECISKSDAILLVIDEEGNAPSLEDLGDISGKPLIIIRNKSDLQGKQEKDWVMTSAINNDVGGVIQKLKDVFKTNEALSLPPFITSYRVLGCLSKAEEAVSECLEAVNSGVSPDIVSSLLLSAYNFIKEALGEDASFDLTDEIFSKFCVGK